MESLDAAFARCWGSAAMETRLIWTWVFSCSCSFIYCVDCFILKSDWGQGISIFLATYWILSLCLLVLFFFCVILFLFLKKQTFQYSHMSVAVLVQEMFLDVLRFHSCGIVGIMMVLIGSPLLFGNGMWNMSCRFHISFWKEDLITRTPDQTLYMRTMCSPL